MKRYLDGMYIADIVNNVFERFDNRDFLYADLMSMTLFQAQLKLLKAK